MPKHYRTDQGNLDPVSAFINLRPSNVIADMTTVSAVELVVGDEIWDVEIVEQTAELLRIRHRYAEEDTATVGQVQIWARMTVVGEANPILSKAFYLTVVAK